MKKYSILIILTLCLFIEIFFELQLPFLTIILGLILGFLSYYTDNISSSKKVQKLIVSTTYYIVKYISALWLIFVYFVFMDYTIDNFQLIHYVMLTIISLSLIGLDFWDIFKWYRHKSTINSI
jgi:hypothetical protein